MKSFMTALAIVVALLLPPVVSSYQVASTLHLVGTACDGGGGGW